jgi:hypothetical protein
MSASDLGPQLRRLYGNPPADSRSREALEERLLRLYDANTPRPRRPLSLGWAVAGVMLFSGAALAMSMPSQVPVEVGKRILVQLKAESRSDMVPTQIADLAHDGGAKVMDLWVKARRYQGRVEVEVTIWGDRLPPDEDLVRLLQERLPDYVTSVQVQSLEGHVHASLAHRLVERLLNKDLSQEERAAARDELIGQLRGPRGTNPQVEVKVIEDEDGHHILQMKVHPEDLEPE